MQRALNSQCYTVPHTSIAAPAIQLLTQSRGTCGAGCRPALPHNAPPRHACPWIPASPRKGTKWCEKTPVDWMSCPGGRQTRVCCRGLLLGVGVQKIIPLARSGICLILLMMMMMWGCDGTDGRVKDARSNDHMSVKTTHTKSRRRGGVSPACPAERRFLGVCEIKLVTPSTDRSPHYVCVLCRLPHHGHMHSFPVWSAMDLPTELDRNAQTPCAG